MSHITLDFVIKDGPDGMKSLVMEAKGLRAVMEEYVKVAKSFENKMIDLTATNTELATFRESLSSISSVLGNLTKESGEFNSAMRAANTTAGKDAEGFAALKGEVSELAKSLPVARDELATCECTKIDLGGYAIALVTFALVAAFRYGIR